MFGQWLRQAISRSFVRIGLAVLLLVAGLAPVGVPIFSDTSWQHASAAPSAAANAARPFLYRFDATGDTTRVLRSDDGGRSWHQVAGIPQPVSALEAMAGDEQTVFAASRNAIWISRDGGTSWAQAAGLPSRPMALAVTAVKSGLVLVGTESAGLLVSRDLGASWQRMEDGTLAGSGAAPLAVTALAAANGDDAILYAATGIWLGTSRAHLTPLGVFVSLDGGRRWLEMAATPLGAGPITRLTPVDGRPLVVSAAGATETHAIEMKLTPELLAQLDSDDPVVRGTASLAIGLTGDVAALPALLAHIDDPDDLAGERIAEAIGRLGDTAAVPELLAALASPQEGMQARAARGLGLLRAATAVPPLARVLHTGQPMTARAAAEALAAIGTADAWAALVAPLSDADMTAARHAAMAGLEMGGAAAAEALTAALQDSRPAVRANSAEMLGWLKVDGAADALAQTLKDPEPVVRSQAAWALGEIATPQANAMKSESDPIARQAASDAFVRAETAAGGSQVVAGAWGSRLLEAAGQIPAGRWSFLGLSVMLAAALLWLGPRQTGLARR